MRITHIARYDCLGGAAWSAYRLHEGLRRLGVESRMVVEKRHSSDPDVFEANAPNRQDLQLQRLAWVEEHYVRKNRSELSNTYYSLNEPGYDLANHRAICDADILNLHWVAGFVSPRELSQLAALGKPVLWTLHDQRPYTGGCHFTAGCGKFETTCSACPQLHSDPANIAEAQLRDEIACGPPNLIICPSEWMARTARRSARFRDTPQHIIPYGVDTELFRPRPKADIRKALGLEPGSVYVLFGADNSNEKRKGFHHLIEVLNRCAADEALRTEIEAKRLALLCLGHPSRRLAELKIPVVPVGYTKSLEKVSEFYAASDVFVLPSLEDNLPNTILEAMSSGLPVVAFSSGGIPDVLIDGRNGRLAATGDTGAMAKAMRSLLLDSTTRETFGMNGRAVIEKGFTLEAQATKYFELYQSLLKNALRVPAGMSTGPASSTVHVRFGKGFAQAYRRIATGKLPAHVKPESPFPECPEPSLWQRVPLAARLWYECSPAADKRRRQQSIDFNMQSARRQASK